MTRHVLLEVTIERSEDLSEEEFEKAMEEAFGMKKEKAFCVKVLAVGEEGRMEN